MEEREMWILTGFISVVMTGVTIFLAWKDNEKKSWSAFAAVSLAACSVLLEYKLVDIWVLHEDWSALMDVVPGMYLAYRNYLIFIIAVNAAAVVLRRGRKK